MRHKTAELIDAKADDSGTFTALASVFGNVDVVGDRMMKGAFRKTLERWRESGNPLPIILSHQWDDAMAHIGKADPNEVTETDDGLVVNGKLDLDNAVAKQVHRLMKERRLTGWSFGYQVPADGEKTAEDGVNEVYEVDLIEAGPTLVGANPEAQLQAVKSALEETSKDEEPEEAKSPEDATDPAVEDATDEEPEKAKSRAQDPLKRASLATALEVLSDGASLHKYEEEEPQIPSEPPTEDAQRRRFCDLTLT